jgi:hypothetical protein
MYLISFWLPSASASCDKTGHYVKSGVSLLAHIHLFGVVKSYSRVFIATCWTVTCWSSLEGFYNYKFETFSELEPRLANGSFKVNTLETLKFKLPTFRSVGRCAIISAMTPFHCKNQRQMLKWDWSCYLSKIANHQ